MNLSAETGKRLVTSARSADVPTKQAPSFSSAAVTPLSAVAASVASTASGKICQNRSCCLLPGCVIQATIYKIEKRHRVINHLNFIPSGAHFILFLSITRKPP